MTDTALSAFAAAWTTTMIAVIAVFGGARPLAGVGQRGLFPRAAAGLEPRLLSRGRWRPPANVQRPPHLLMRAAVPRSSRPSQQPGRKRRWKAASAGALQLLAQRNSRSPRDRRGTGRGRSRSPAGGGAAGGQIPIPARASRGQSNSSPGSVLRSGAISEWPTTRCGGIGCREIRSRHKCSTAAICASGNGRYPHSWPGLTISIPRETALRPVSPSQHETPA